VNRGKDAMKIRRIAQRFISQNIDNVTRFYLYEEKLAQSKTSVGLLFTRPYLAGTLMLWLTYFMGLVIYYVLLSWMPILMQGLGYQLEQSAILTSLFTFGGTLGILAAGWLMDRWNAHKVVSSGFVVTALLIVAMATEDSHIVLLGTFIFLMGITMNGAQSGLQTLAATFYPTHSRATGIAWMQGIGRFGGVAGTMMGAQLLAMHWEVQSILMFLCVPALIAAIATVFKMTRRAALQPTA